jgi:hypothetical protein
VSGDDSVTNVAWLTDWPQPADVNDCVVNLPQPPTVGTRIRVGGDPVVWEFDGERWEPLCVVDDCDWARCCQLWGSLDPRCKVNWLSVDPEDEPTYSGYLNGLTPPNQPGDLR